MRGKREIRRQARASVYALLDVNLDAEDGDLWITVEEDEYDEDERDEFRAEVRRIMGRIG